MSEIVEVKFGEWIDKGFKLYKENIGLLILAGLIVTLLGFISALVLIGPLVVGLCMLTLRLLDGDTEPKPAPGDVFKGFNKFLNGFLFFLVLFIALMTINLVLGIIPRVGRILALVLSYGVMALVMFAPFLIAETDLGFWPACQKSIEKVKPNLLPFVGFSVVAGLIGSLGAILCGIGIFLTLPLQYAMIAVAYRDVFGDGDGGDTLVEPLVADETNSAVSAETQAAAEVPPLVEPTEEPTEPTGESGSEEDDSKPTEG